MRQRRVRRTRRLGALAAAVVCAIASTGCGVFAAQPVFPTATPPGVEANVLLNSSFEAGADPWFLRQPEWRPFTVNNQRPLGGNLSLELELWSAAEEQGSAVSGAAQRLTGDVFPEFLSGYYYVEEWSPPEPFQYLEFVVSVIGGNHPDGIDVHEMRFIIAGAPSDPFTLLNGRFRHLDRDEPRIGEWTYFSYPVLEAIRTELGWDPLGWEAIEVSFEVRYDEKAPGKPAVAKVYYDDLYLGPQRLNPNRPIGG